MVASHIKKCREIPALTHALAVVIPESNLPVIATGILRGLKGLALRGCIFMTEEDNKGSSIRYDMPGSITTHKNKPEMVHMLKETMRAKRVVFYRHFIVAEAEFSAVDDKEGGCQ